MKLDKSHILSGGVCAALGDRLLFLLLSAWDIRRVRNVNHKCRYMEKDCIERFVEAQDAGYAGYKQALEEVKKGMKVGHWIWYMFPQMRGLGRSGNSAYYGIADREVAEEYLRNEILNARIHEISEALLQHKDKSAINIFGPLDAKKVLSSMTLFDVVSPNDVFGRVIDQFYGGVHDKRTWGLLK